jgi:hypothetical protein
MILDYVQIVHPLWEVTNDLLAQYLLLWFVSFQMMMFPFEHGVFFLAWFMLFIFNCMMSKPTKGEAGIMLRLLWSQHLNANIWEFSSIETRCSFWFPKWWTRAAQNFYKASEHLLRKLEELHTAQPSSLETTHENHSTDMNIFSFNTQVSRSSQVLPFEQIIQMGNWLSKHHTEDSICDIWWVTNHKNWDLDSLCL